MARRVTHGLRVARLEVDWLEGKLPPKRSQYHPARPMPSFGHTVLGALLTHEWEDGWPRLSRVHIRRLPP